MSDADHQPRAPGPDAGRRPERPAHGRRGEEPGPDREDHRPHPLPGRRLLRRRRRGLLAELEPLDLRWRARGRPVRPGLRAHRLGQVPHAPGPLRRGAPHCSPRRPTERDVHVGRPGRALRRRRQAAPHARRPLRSWAPASSRSSPPSRSSAPSAPCPGDSLETTGWRKGSVLVDSSGRPVRKDTLVVGGIMTVYPKDTVSPRTGFITDEGQSVDQTVLIRVSDQPFTTEPGRENWTPDGYVAYSKVCTHLGLPGRPLRAAARAAGLPVPPVDVQRAQRRGAPVRTGAPPAAPDAPRL